MIIIKVGDKFGRLTTIKFSYKDKKSRQFWLFKCDCGVEKVIRVDHIKSGRIKSCGCLYKKTNRKHGKSYTRTYCSWSAMKKRCLNKNYFPYKNYGGRGIKVCDRWMKFENFYKDMGDRPEGKSLDRINNNGNYELSNCRWADSKTQNNNRRKRIIK